MKNLLKPSLILLIIAGVIFICEGTNQIRIIRDSPTSEDIHIRVRDGTGTGLYNVARGILALNYTLDDFAYMFVGTTFIVTGLSLMVKLKELESG